VEKHYKLKNKEYDAIKSEILQKHIFTTRKMHAATNIHLDSSRTKSYKSADD